MLVVLTSTVNAVLSFFKMIISKTPLRISFFGGGTDFPEFYLKHGGAVLGASIDKNIYHTVNYFHSDLFEHSIRLAYRKVECVRSIDEIEHKPFQAILRYVGLNKDIEITLAADLPSFSGLGSSSSFTVGLVNALSAYQGRFIPSRNLAQIAINIERDILGEAVGVQDQIFAAFGGFNLIQFTSDGDFNVHRIPISKDRLDELDHSLLLFFTGITRRAVDIESNKIRNLNNISATLCRMLKLVDRAHNLLVSNSPISAFGELLDATWMEKRLLDPCVSRMEIDMMYQIAKDNGALGGKLLGAGGGGFMLFFVPQEKKHKLRTALRGYHEVPFRLGTSGSTIIHS